MRKKENQIGLKEGIDRTTVKSLNLWSLRKVFNCKGCPWRRSSKRGDYSV